MQDKLIVGWCEWLILPDFNFAHLKAKVDTGARTSALHAYELEQFTLHGNHFVRFNLHLTYPTPHLLACRAPLIDRRRVTDSGGHWEERYVIKTDIQLSNIKWSIEMTLTNRDNMRFPMLLGRTAMNGKLLVDPQHAYLLGAPRKPKPRQKSIRPYNKKAGDAA